MSGWTVYFYTIIPFATMRCFEQIRVDVAYQNTNVKIVGVGAGLSYGPAGATHHSIEDISIMRSLPNMKVFCPGDPIETAELVKASAANHGPVYIRLGKNGEPKLYPEATRLQAGVASVLRQGSDLALVSTSNMLENTVRLAERLQARGVQCTVLSQHTMKPFDTASVQALIERKIPIATIEEHSIIGGLGSAVADVIAASGQGVRFQRIALPDEYSHHVGSQEVLRKLYGLDVESLESRCVAAFSL